MPILTERNYLRAMQPLGMNPGRDTAIISDQGGRLHVGSSGSMAMFTVIFETAPWSEDWTLVIPADEAARSRAWDGSGLRWNTLFERILKHARTGEAKYAELHRKLSELRQLKKGWDSYDAEPPSAKACELAEGILVVLQMHGLPPDFLTATSDGSLMLRHCADHAVVTWEIDDDGEIGVMVERPGAEPEYTSPQEGQIGSVVAKLARNG